MVRTDADVFYRTMAVNFQGVVHTVQSVLPRMLLRGEGRILLISSIAAHLSKVPSLRVPAFFLQKELRETSPPVDALLWKYCSN